MARVGPTNHIEPLTLIISAQVSTRLTAPRSYICEDSMISIGFPDDSVIEALVQDAEHLRVELRRIARESEMSPAFAFLLLESLQDGERPAYNFGLGRVFVARNFLQEIGDILTDLNAHTDLGHHKSSDR
jgi:hypothetical protein